MTSPLSKEVTKLNSLTLAFAKAVGTHQADKTDNLVVAPYNALTCLSMVAKGADHNTREEMAQTLFGVSADKLDAEVASLASLNTQILDANKDKVELRTANGVWTNKDILKLNRNFAADLKQIFGAEISEEDFSSPATVKKINTWAGDNTNQLITEVLKKLSKDDAAVLASALYFKGDWTHPFDTKDTVEDTFKPDAGIKALVTTPTMNKFYKKGQLTYKDGVDYEAVALTYGSEDRKNGAAPSMRIVLIRPKDDNVSARDWMGAEAANGNPEWLDAASFERQVQGGVHLPKIDIKQNHDLIPALQDIGMKDAFDENRADFAPMEANGKRELYIGKVSHDVVFKTDEKGSEAAAVTTVGMMRMTSIPAPVKTIDVKFDRSFVFALQDIKTDAVLFIGAVNKPNAEMTLLTPSSAKKPNKCLIGKDSIGKKPKR